MATKLSEKESEGQKLIFGNMNELNNLFETLKLLKSQIEKTNEIRKIETELIRQNTKYLSDYSKNISNMVKEINITDNSKARNVRTLLAENNLINQGISLESNYAKNYISRYKGKSDIEAYIDLVSRLVAEQQSKANVGTKKANTQERKPTNNLNIPISCFSITQTF